MKILIKGVISRIEMLQLSERKEETLYSQTQIASKLKISQSTVTRLLKKNGIKPVKTKGKSKLYSDEQIDNLNLSILHQKEKYRKNYDNSDISIFLQKEISKLHDENEKLEKNYSEQLKAKDKQINDLNKRLEEAHKLQLGLEQKLKMLPDSSSEKTVVDAKAVDAKENPDKSPQKTNKRGFWSRLFGL